MNYWLYFFQIILIQYTSAQVMTLGGRNLLNNQNCANMAKNYANNAMLSNIGQSQLNNMVASPNIMQQEYLNANMLSNAYGIANANGVASGNMGSYIGVPSGNIGVANIGESAVVYKSVPMYASAVKPPREYGIEFSSGALQVGGTVEVNGRMPFNANVAINGAVPSQGQGAVNYACDKLNEES